MAHIVGCSEKRHRLFADDCILYRQIKSPSDRAVLQKDIDMLYNWSQTWQMVFNAKKCHILNISRKRQKTQPHYQLGLEALSVVDSYPSLGVTISHNLRWHQHINNISAKATRTLNFVRCNIYSCSPDAKALAYTALVRPHLEYASAAWSHIPLVTFLNLIKSSTVLHVSPKITTNGPNQFHNLLSNWAGNHLTNAGEMLV